MKILAIDYGSKRVGLALGDNETKLALPFGVIEREDDDKLVAKILELIEAEEIDRLIIGEPITLAGQISEQTKINKKFVDIISKKVLVPVELVDERLTSSRADAAILGTAAPTRSRDELAAMFFLQDYLDREPLAK